jgi:DeoR/GlpR family transcriptional regulator of sugar metabolism
MRISPGFAACYPLILERLRRNGAVFAAELTKTFQASEDTVRRDLRDLAGRGLCRRVYGGALPMSPASGVARARAVEDTDRKAALGASLAALIAPGQFVFIDAGLTNLAAARRLPDGLGATIATHDPESRRR